MSVDFVARALAKQQSQSGGQGQSFTTLATGIPAVQFPAAVKIMQTSGYASEGIGAGTYVSDPLATAGLASAHPRFCKADAAGRYWRLLPDENGLIPVVCGGAPGFAQDQVRQYSLVMDAPAGTTNFSIYPPWGTNLTFASAGIPGPGGAGTASTITATGNWACINYVPPSNGTYLYKARVHAGTAARFSLLCNRTGAGGQASEVLCWFDLAAGTITTDHFGTGQITDLGGGWYEVEFTAACDTTGFIGLGLSNNEDPSQSTAGITVILYDIRIYSVTMLSMLETTDDRAIIQAAIKYCEAIDAAGTRYDAANYALRRINRTPSAPNDIHSDKSGLMLQINKSHKFISTCGGTTWWRRDTDGSAMGIAKFQTCTGSGGYYWRGGGIFVEGRTVEPADPSENSIYLYDLMLDGGITDSSEQNNPYGPSMQADGDGWDLSDKGIWQSNDRYCGNVVLEGRSGIRYFMGELIYSSGVGASTADRVIGIGSDADLGHTCGSCINANGATLRVERCQLHNAYMGVEGWTGHAGGYFKAVISDTNRNTIQGGTPHFGAGSYYEKTRPVANVLPMGFLDVLLRKAGTFEVGSYLYGRIESIDCAPTLGNLAAFTTGCQDVDLEIVTWADQLNVLAAVNLLGGAQGDKSTDRVTLRVTPKRTDQAAAAGRGVGLAVYYYGSFGPEVAVTVHGTAGLITPSSTVYDNTIRIVGAFPDSGTLGPYYNIETNNNATIDLKNLGNTVALYGTTTGGYSVNLPSSGIPHGYRQFLWNATGNVSGAMVTARVPGANMRGGKDLLIPPNDFALAEVEFDGQKWFVVTPPPPLQASATWDPSNVTTGASTTTTVTLGGAVAADKVDAVFSNSLQGMVLSAYVSAANTVTVVLSNPTGSAVNLASGTLTVTVR